MAGELTQVPHDQEIRVEPHAVDDLQLVIQALHNPRISGLFSVAPGQPLLAKIAQVGLLVVPLRHREYRQVVTVILKLDLTLLGNGQRVGQRLRDFGEKLPHLFRRAEVVAGIGHAHPVWLALHAAGLDAQQGIMRIEVFRHDVVRVVGCHQRHPVVLAVGHQPAVQHPELIDVVFLQLQVEVLRAKDILVPADQIAQGAVIFAFFQQARNFRRQAATGRDQPLRMTGKQFFVHPRAVVVTADLGFAGQLKQVAVARLVAGQQQQMVRLGIQGRIAVIHAAPGQVRLHANHGFNSRLPGGPEELDHAKHRAVIGDRQRRHAQFFGARHQPVDLAQAVQQGVFGMDMQMDEGFIRAHDRFQYTRSAIQEGNSGPGRLPAGHYSTDGRPTARILRCGVTFGVVQPAPNAHNRGRRSTFWHSRSKHA